MKKLGISEIHFRKSFIPNRACTVFGEFFQFFHSFSVTADYNVIGVRPSSGNATSFSSLAPFTLASGSRPAPMERLVQPGSGAAGLNPVRGAMFIVTDATTRGFLFFSGAAEGPKAAVRGGRWGRLDVESSAARRAAEKQERCG